MIRIALVEDDLVLRDRILVPNLHRAGFEVHAMSLAAELRQRLDDGLPTDIAVLDVGLPDGDGYALASECRAARPALGIVMLTGRKESSDVVLGLSGGADAYLTKPVSVEVLIATLDSLARRLGVADHMTRQSPPWRLASGEWTLRTPSGTRIGLTASERLLLSTLFRSAGEVLHRETLIAAMTDSTHDYDPHRLDSLIHRLRRKVGAATDEVLPLNVVPGAGYVLTPADV